MKTFRSDENQIKNKTKTTQSADKKRNVKKKKPAKKIYRTNAKKDTVKLANRINIRMRLVAGLVAFCMAALVVYIGIRAALTNEEYERKALSQMNYSSSTLVAKSGEIYDTNMTPIAVSSRVYILIIDPKVIMETEAIDGRKGTLETTVKAIAQCFDLDEAALTNTITQSADKNYIRYVPEGWTSKKYLVTESQKEAFDALEEKVNSTEKKKETKTTQAQSVQETEGTSSVDEEFESPEGAKIVGVWFETEYQRYYPYGNLASKVIGFTTKDSSEGIWGLERYYNEELRGTNGRSYSYNDSSKNLIRDVIEPTDGYSLVSTIDMNLTKILSDTASEWYYETDENGERVRTAKSYSILAMDPNTGAIKAMVTDTDYDLNNPNDLSVFYTDEELATFADNEVKSEEYEKYLILSTISDIKASVKENAALPSLAFVLYGQGDITRAYHYIKRSLEDAIFCNARLRTIEISGMLPVIDAAYKLQIERQRRQLVLFLIIVSLLSVFLVISVVLIYKQVKKLSVARRHLRQANHIKEEYIGHFLNLCSLYIEKLDNFRRTVNRKITAGQTEELLKLTKSSQFAGMEQKEFYANFDNAFLHLYPDFVTEFNRLLQPEERFIMKPGELLNTELRIFAIIRLGIDDSSKIANFLHYSINTIYTYRNKVKNKAINRENFEEEIMKIGVLE